MYNTNGNNNIKINIMKTILNTAALYVGTYAKYNNGSINGAWLTLADYDSGSEFLAACNQLHSDEEDPELMFQDYEGFPQSLYSESSLFDFWALAEELENNGIEDLELYVDACAYFGYDPATSFDWFTEAYQGEQSEEDFAMQIVEDMIPTDAPEFLTRYFDYDKFQRDLFIGDYTSFEGHIFRSL